MVFYMRYPDLTTFDGKKLVAPSLVLLALALVSLGYGFAATGTPVQLGMDFRGGVAVSINTGDSPDLVSSEFSEFGIVETRDLPDGVLLEFAPMGDQREQQLESAVARLYESYQITTVSEVFGEDLQSQAGIAMVIAFLAMAVIVMALFRRAVPAGTIVFAALSDIVIAAGFMNQVGLNLSLGTVAAMLMLIGYSVDSNILLTNWMLKRRGSISKRFNSAFRTGATMAVTTLSAIGVLGIVSFLGGITVLYEIAAVLLAGLVADILNTWLLNGYIMRRILVQEGVELR